MYIRFARRFTWQQGTRHEDPDDGQTEDTLSEPNGNAGSDDGNRDEEVLTAVTLSDEDSEREPEPDRDPKMTATCCACAETKPETVTVRLPCAHIYCHDCIIELFDFAVHKDASLFPPRCCKIPISENMYSFLPAKLLEEVHTKKATQDYEHSTFCSGCWAFIPDDMIEHSVATCSKCQTKTCTTCGDKAHEGLCSEDDDTKLLMATVAKVSWQRCSRCKNMVELSHGCLHIMYVLIHTPLP